MEITQEELLEQSKVSALESALYKGRLEKAAALYAALHKEVINARKPYINALIEYDADEVEASFNFIDKFPVKIEF